MLTIVNPGRVTTPRKLCQKVAVRINECDSLKVSSSRTGFQPYRPEVDICVLTIYEEARPREVRRREYDFLENECPVNRKLVFC